MTGPRTVLGRLHLGAFLTLGLAGGVAFWTLGPLSPLFLGLGGSAVGLAFWALARSYGS